jgi:hypothetical protein
MTYADAARANQAVPKTTTEVAVAVATAKCRGCNFGGSGSIES